MSRGYGGSAKLVLRDEKTLIYKYYAFNLNYPEHRNTEREYDGLITIDISAFVEPEIHTKLKRFPNDKKKIITKRIINDVDYSQLISDKKIVVENSRFCWRKLDKSVGFIAYRIIRKIFTTYQEEEIIPETISIMS